jgi:hypothetical protein
MTRLFLTLLFFMFAPLPAQAYQVDYNILTQARTTGCQSYDLGRFWACAWDASLSTPGWNPGCNTPWTHSGSPATAQFRCWADRMVPVWLGSFWDCSYDQNDYTAMFMLAPGPAVNINFTGGYSGWDVLFCDPNTLATSFPSAATLTTWFTGCNGFPLAWETVDMFTVSLNLSSSLIGTQWIAQWARYTENATFLSDAWQIDIY